MGLFDKLKKPKDPQRAKGAAMLFCPEPDPRKALDRVEELSAVLKETIILRETYPELTLRELAEEFEPPVTKSCLQHRLRKLVELSRQ